jgi:hypothetical protein
MKSVNFPKASVYSQKSIGLLPESIGLNPKIIDNYFPKHLGAF